MDGRGGQPKGSIIKIQQEDDDEPDSGNDSNQTLSENTMSEGAAGGDMESTEDIPGLPKVDSLPNLADSTRNLVEVSK